jgi:hypothetical protein
LLLVALVAFWPSYLSQRFAVFSSYTHLHAFTATLWMLMLIAQPLLVRRGRLHWHRRLGRASYVIAPVVVGTILLLAHSRLQGISGEAWAIQTYVLYLQLSLAVLFTTWYALAIATRRTTFLHSRFMVGTGLTLIDPVFIRILFWIDSTPAWNYQWLTFGLTDLALVALLWFDRARPAARRLWLAMLAVFVLSQIPALFGWTAAPAWQSFTRWYASLPLPPP